MTEPIEQPGSPLNNMTHQSNQEQLLERKVLCQLPTTERLAWVERIRVFYRRWVEITGQIELCHSLQPHAAEPPCLLVVGPTGAGKTTLFESYAVRYGVYYTPTGTVRPILKATIPTPASEKNLATALLQGLGDPLAGRGTTASMTQRVIKLLKDCRVEMLMLDELQHFVDRDSQRVLQNASNWLKMVIKESRVACVLIGLEGEAEQVVNINPQLARLFGDPLVLSPFRWDEAQPETIKEFRVCLADLEGMLPLREPSHLSRRELAWRCYVASGGIMSYLMALVQWATRLALLVGQEQLDLSVLAQAFEQRLAGTRRGLSNPFVGPLPPPLPSQTPTSVTLGATNNRSQARQPRKETLQDVLQG